MHGMYAWNDLGTPTRIYDANVFMVFALVSWVLLSIMLVLTEAISQRKSFLVTRSRGGSLSQRFCAPQDVGLLVFTGKCNLLGDAMLGLGQAFNATKV